MLIDAGEGKIFSERQSIDGPVTPPKIMAAATPSRQTNWPVVVALKAKFAILGPGRGKHRSKRLIIFNFFKFKKFDLVPLQNVFFY